MTAKPSTTDATRLPGALIRTLWLPAILLLAACAGRAEQAAAPEARLPALELRGIRKAGLAVEGLAPDAFALRGLPVALRGIDDRVFAIEPGKLPQLHEQQEARAREGRESGWSSAS